MSVYLRQLSFGEIVRGSFEIYGKHFFTIFLTYSLPVFPLSFLAGEALAEEEYGVYLALVLVNLVVASLVYAALVVILSDICLGNKPGIGRSYKYVFGPILWKLISTNILQLLAILAGFILLFIPGVIFMIWLIFVPIIVILEKKGGVDALKRSKSLGKGYFWRTFGLMAFFMVFGGLVGGILGAVVGGIGIDEVTYRGLLTAMQVLLQPLVLLMIILSYYDLRVNKEAYDATALAEDLHR